MEAIVYFIVGVGLFVAYCLSPDFRRLVDKVQE
jgi:hypothetical protein